MKMFNQTNPNAFRYRSWYAIIVSMVLMLYVSEVLYFIQDFFDFNIPQEHMSDSIMFGVIIYWALCFVIPYWIMLKLIARYGDGVSSNDGN